MRAGADGIMTRPHAMRARADGIMTRPQAMRARAGGIMTRPHAMRARLDGIMTRPHAIAERTCAWAARNSSFLINGGQRALTDARSVVLLRHVVAHQNGVSAWASRFALGFPNNRETPKVRTTRGSFADDGGAVRAWRTAPPLLQLAAR
jgi:hypothetical protein